MFAPRLSEPALVVYDASPGAVALAGLLEAPEQCLLWTPPQQAAGRSQWIARSAALVAEATGSSCVQDSTHAAVLSGLTNEAIRATALVLLAADEALRRGLGVVLLPWTVGERGAHVVAQAVDQTGLLTALLQCSLDSCDAGASQLSVQAPVVDLTPAQTATLVREAALPAQAVVVCAVEPPPGCGSCAACALWRKAQEASAAAFSTSEALPVE